MKKRSITILLVCLTTFCAGCVAFFVPARSFAADAAPVVKLPYAKGQSFVVTQGYNTPPTHIKKDSYALDFTQNGCDAYGLPVVAAVPGTVMFLSQEGYNGGYGTELIVDHGNNIVSRYAHMIPGSIAVAATGTVIRQGQAIGLVGDTGLVAGAACVAHPGTHLHFAMDSIASDGTFSAYDPEPISGYTNMTAGKWYRSDNEEDADSVDELPSSTEGQVLGAYDAATTTNATTSAIATTTTASSSAPSLAIPFSGGVSISSPSVNVTPPSTPAVTVTPQASTTISTSTSTSTATSTSINNSDSDITTSTASNATDTSETASSSVSASGTLFEQLDDSISSGASWYDDNWFRLGNGFSGTLNTLVLEGHVSDVNYLSSHVALQVFKDKDYETLIQQFPISDDAPFTPVMATATFSGLSILLKPYFYYRLATSQDYQNRSVLLAGTASTTVGVAMQDRFLYGTGRVETTSTFFPFMMMQGIAATSTLTPPPLTTPTNLAENFDELGMQLNLSWATSTDPDWPANPLHYEMNYSTSTALSDADWIDPAQIPVVFGNTYLIGVRAVDNYGDVSAAATATWNFPVGFTPYLLSRSIGYAAQHFTVPSTSTLQSITLFTTNVQTGARFIASVGCSLQVFDYYDLSSLGMTQSDNGFGGYGCGGTPTFTFASSSLMLYPDHQYEWVFNAGTGNPSTGAGVQFYGTATDTAGGQFSDPSLVNAKFTVTGDSGVLFSN